MSKIAILQSNYIPWKGVFDMINQVNKFVFFEDVQYTKRDWRTRNKIKTANGELWLTVPVNKTNRDTKIFEVEVCNTEDWQKKHYDSIKHNYAKAPYFQKYHWILEKLYLERKWENLSEFNMFATILIARELGITTEFYNSKDLNTTGTKDDKLIEICEKLGGDFYLSGPAAKDYIVNEKFKNHNIRLAYIKYDAYPEYKQLHGEFNHFVTVLDVLFHCGEESPKYIFANRWEEVNL